MAAATKKSRRKIAVVIAGLALLSSPGWWIFDAMKTRGEIATPDSVSSISVIVASFGRDDERLTSTFEINDRQSIDKVIASLRNADACSNHACIVPVTMEINRSVLSNQRLQLKPAHKSGRLNYILNGDPFEFDAGPLLTALSKLDAKDALDWVDEDARAALKPREVSGANDAVGGVEEVSTTTEASSSRVDTSR